MLKKRMLPALLIGGVLMGATAAYAEPKLSDAQSAIAAAEEARKQAASVKSEWDGTAEIIEKAKAAAEKGDFAEAVKLAAEAKDEGDMGYAQGKEQQVLHMPGYLK